MEIAALGIKVEGVGVDEAATDLERLAVAGKKAEDSATGVGNAWDKARAKLGTSTRSTQESTTAIRAQQAELGKLLGQIDPVTAALGRLDEQEKKLRQFKSKGLVDVDTFTEYSAKINGARQSLGKFDDSLSRTGNTAKQNANALRQLPAQFSDIAISLQAGQSPLQVFLQQGAQIKDSFGGAGNALAETAKYAVGLINPLTVAAAAAVAIGVAWKQGSDEAVAFNRAIILSGNSAGVSSDKLANMAAEIDMVAGTQRQAAAALAQITESGKFTADQFQAIATAAVAFENATGKAIAGTIDEFARLADEPASASAKLNEQYNFLTGSIYAQITALEEQGRTTEAAKLAIDTYGEALKQRSDEINANLGLIEKSWLGIKNVAAEAWDEMLGIGREKSLDDQLKDLEAGSLRIGDVASRGAVLGPLGAAKEFYGQIFDIVKGTTDEGQKQLELQKEALRSAIDQRDAEAEASGKEAEINKKSIAAQAQLNAGLKESRTNAQKLAEEYARIEKLAKEAAAGGKEFSRAQIEQLRAAAAERFKDRDPARSRKPAAFQDDAATKQLQTLRAQEAALTAQLETGAKLTATQKELVEFNQKIADLKSKDILTAEQKSLLNGEAAIRAQLELNANIEDEIRKRAQATDNERLRIQILKETGQIRAANDAQLDLDYAQKRVEFEREGNVEALARLDTLKKINEIQRETTQKPGTVEGVSQAPKIGGLDADVGGASSEIKRLDREANELEEWRENELEKQAAFLEAKAINEETYIERIANIEEQSREKRAQIEDVKNSTLLASADTFFGQMATLSQSGNKKLATIGKAAAIAQATMSGFTAVMNALAVPPYPVGLALAVSAGVITAANIANIAGVGFRSGGYTGSGSDNQIAGPVHKNEFVFDSAATARIGAGNLEALRSGSAQSAAMSSNVIAMPQRSRGNVAVTQNIMVQGNVDRRTAGQIARDTSQKQRMAQSRFG